MSDEDFVNVNKEVKLPADEIEYIEKNPEGLTKEGIQHNLDSWSKNSRNQYVIKRYQIMKERCKVVATSGKLDDGRTILARHPDGTMWAEKLD